MIYSPGTPVTLRAAPARIPSPIKKSERCHGLFPWHLRNPKYVAPKGSLQGKSVNEQKSKHENQFKSEKGKWEMEKWMIEHFQIWKMDERKWTIDFWKPFSFLQSFTFQFFNDSYVLDVAFSLVKFKIEIPL